MGIEIKKYKNNSNRTIEQLKNINNAYIYIYIYIRNTNINSIYTKSRAIQAHRIRIQKLLDSRGGVTK